MKFTYSCEKCGGTVSKDPVTTTEEGVRVYGLHGWRCNNGCKAPVKVKRVIRKKEKDSD